MLNADKKKIAAAVSDAEKVSRDAFVRVREALSQVNGILQELQLECANNGGHNWDKYENGSPPEGAVCTCCGFDFGP